MSAIIFITFRRSLKLSKIQDSSCIKVNRSISDISLLSGILDAVSALKFRPLEPHLLTVSGARHFGDPEKPASDGDSTGVTEDENSLPTETQLCVVFRESSIKLWDLSTRRDL